MLSAGQSVSKQYVYVPNIQMRVHTEVHKDLTMGAIYYQKQLGPNSYSLDYQESSS